MKNRQLWCNNCLSYTIHKVQDHPKANLQNISCIECSMTTANQIINRRVKINKEFYDEYQQRKPRAERS
jgi:ribosomal protein L44E